MIRDFSELDLSKQYTFKDYLSWQFNDRVELFRGFIAKISPAPNSFHQEFSGNISGPIWSFLKNKKCKIYSAPIDVYLPTIDKKTVVQPDIIVVCDLNKIEKKRLCWCSRYCC